MNNHPPYFTFLNDYDNDTITGVIMSTDTTPEDIRNIVQTIKNKYPAEWTWDDIWMSLPSDCYVCDREWHNTVQIQRGVNNENYILKLLRIHLRDSQ